MWILLQSRPTFIIQCNGFRLHNKISSLLASVVQCMMIRLFYYHVNDGSLIPKLDKCPFLSSLFQEIIAPVFQQKKINDIRGIHSNRHKTGAVV